MPGPARLRSYDLFVLVLSVYSLAVLGLETLAPLSQATRQIFLYADTGVCVLFFGDFLFSLWTAPDRKLYMIRWGWIDLLSSIPMVSALRLGRAARIMRIVRVLRGFRSTKNLAGLLLRKRAEGVFLAAALISILLVVFCSVAILQFETSADANIKTPADALWWAFVTITTVGYGDRFPLSPEGRIVAGLLMTAGVGLFGTFSGFVASWFLAPGEKEQESELAEVRLQLTAIRTLLEKAHPQIT